MISESVDNPQRLFFRCRLNRCGFFDWWRMEDDNPFVDDENDGVTSIRRQEMVSNLDSVEDVCESTVENYGYDSVRGINVVVILLLCCVILLFFVVLLK